MTIPPETIGEAIKLAIQFVGALVVARMTVRWALNRFKREKRWEREVNALADVVGALSEMRRIYGKWIDEHISGQDFADAYKQELEADFRAARRKYDSVFSLAALLLPSSFVSILTELQVELDGKRSDSYFDSVNDAWAIIDGAIRRLIDEGRKSIG